MRSCCSSRRVRSFVFVRVLVRGFSGHTFRHVCSHLMFFCADDVEEIYLFALCSKRFVACVFVCFFQTETRSSKYVFWKLSCSYVDRVCSCALTFSGISAAGNFVCDLPCMVYSRDHRTGNLGWDSQFGGVS